MIDTQSNTPRRISVSPLVPESTNQASVPVVTRPHECDWPCSCLSCTRRDTLDSLRHRFCSLRRAARAAGVPFDEFAEALRLRRDTDLAALKEIQDPHHEALGAGAAEGRDLACCLRAGEVLAQHRAQHAAILEQLEASACDAVARLLEREYPGNDLARAFRSRDAALLLASE